MNPTGWKDHGGQGEASIKDGALVVSTTAETHNAVANLLEQVARLTGGTPPQGTGAGGAGAGAAPEPRRSR